MELTHLEMIFIAVISKNIIFGKLTITCFLWYIQEISINNVVCPIKYVYLFVITYNIVTAKENMKKT